MGGEPPNFVRSGRQRGNAVLNCGLVRIAAGSWDGADALVEPGPVDGNRTPWLCMHARNALIPLTVVMRAPGGGPGRVVAVTVGAIVVVVVDAAFEEPLLEHAARPNTMLPVTIRTSHFGIRESDHNPHEASKSARASVSPGRAGPACGRVSVRGPMRVGARRRVLLSEDDDQMSTCLSVERTRST